MAAVSWADVGQQLGEAKPVERVVLRFESGNFQLLARVPLTKVIPPSDDLPATDRPLSGFWYELQSSAAQVKYRRIVANPIRVHFEGSDLDASTKPKRIEGVPAEMVFSLVIPRASEGDQLVLFSSPLTPGGESQPAQVVARVPFTATAK